MLHVHVVDAERFAAIVQGPRARTIGVRQRVALRQEVAVLVHRTKRLVTHFMVNQHELAEIRARAVLDHRLPPASVLRGGPRSQRIVVLRPARLDDEHPEQAHDRQFPVITVRMELPSALLGVRMDVPFHLDGLSDAVLFTVFRRTGRHRIRVGRGCRLPGCTHDHVGPVDVQADLLAEFQRVPQRDFHAIALVAANHQGLDPLVLDAVLHAAGIMMAFFLPGRRVLRFFFANVGNVFGQGVHVAGIEIQPLIQGNLHVDGGHVILPHRRGVGAQAALHRNRFDVGIGGQQAVGRPGPVLVHHRHGIEGARCIALMLRVFLHLPHQTLMLQLDQRRALGASFHRVFRDGLAFEPFSPPRGPGRRGHLMGRSRAGRSVPVEHEQHGSSPSRQGHHDREYGPCRVTHRSAS